MVLTIQDVALSPLRVCLQCNQGLLFLRHTEDSNCSIAATAGRQQGLTFQVCTLGRIVFGRLPGDTAPAAGTRASALFGVPKEQQSLIAL